MMNLKHFFNKQEMLEKRKSPHNIQFERILYITLIVKMVINK